MKTHSSETWRIDLPDDWSQAASTEHGVLVFECADQTKGLYLAAWPLGPAERRSPQEIARAFVDLNEEALAAMGIEWKKLGEGVGEQGNGATILTDHFAAANRYRIVTKVIARQSVAVRGAFHDYLCEDYRASTAYFTSLVDSLLLLK